VLFSSAEKTFEKSGALHGISATVRSGLKSDNNMLSYRRETALPTVL